MGGSISFVKRLDRKVTCVDGYTNLLSSWINKLEFFETPKNIDKYLDMCSEYENLKPDGYGIFIVDYDTKSIYTINGYSNYIDVMPTSYQMYEQGMYVMENGSSMENPYKEWFNKGLLYIKKTTQYGNGESIESSKLDIKFDTLKDMCSYVHEN